MNYLRNLKQLREDMMQSATKSSAPEESPDSLIAARFEEQPQQASTESLLAQSSQWLNGIRASAASLMTPVPDGARAAANMSAAISGGVKLGRKISGKDTAEETPAKSALITRREDTPPHATPKSAPMSNTVSPGYEGVTKSQMEGVIRSEAALRNMDPEVAIRIFKAEGAGAYQSQIARSGKGVHNGKEASFGPYQLFTGGGLGNEYEKETGRNLLDDNTVEGITKQIQFSLDKAVDLGWTPWYGRGPAGVGKRDGLSGSVKVGNWK